MHAGCVSCLSFPSAGMGKAVRRGMMDARGLLTFVTTVVCSPSFHAITGNPTPGSVSADGTCSGLISRELNL